MTTRPDTEGLDRLLIDGDNLLHDVRGRRDEGGIAWLLPRLAEWRPASLDILVALDGHPAPGETRRPRVTRGIEFELAGSRTADDLIIGHLETMPYAQRARSAVVTGDRELGDRARMAGGLVRSITWLMRAIAARDIDGSTRPPSIGQGKPPRGPADAAALTPDDADGGSWRPGRGATRKRGNPRRAPKHRRRR